MSKTFIRLLLLLLIRILFVVAAVPYVGGTSAQSRVVNLNGISGGSTFVKTYQLISRCSDLRVQMKLGKGKNIDARGRKGAPYTLLNFSSDPTGAVRIKGNTSRKFLCFSRKGRLITRADGESPRCMFKEIVEHNFVKLQSADNLDWFVGFNKRGRKLKGYGKQDTWARRKCFMFIKEDSEGTRLPHRHLRGSYMNSDSSSLTIFSTSNR